MSFVICLIMALPVDAASNYFTGSTGTMNSLFGNPSASRNISSGSIPGNASVSSVKVNVNVSSGSDSFYLYVKHPSGYSAVFGIIKMQRSAEKMSQQRLKKKA